MAVVAPSTNVILCQNVPLDKTYKDTLTFPNRNAQYTYFASKGAFRAENCQFVKTEGAIRFPETAEQIDTCNYLMFQNEGFGTKWYYAFIDRVEYAQTGMSRIWFTLDVMQTWAFDYVVHPCMVVREHVTDDSIGANLAPEDFALGPYVSSGLRPVEGLLEPAGYYAIIGVTESDVEDEITGIAEQYGGLYLGVYQAVNYYACNLVSDAPALTAMIERYTRAGKANAIVALYLCPANFLPDSITGQLDKIPNSLTPIYKDRELPGVESSLDGYTPRNNKLFTYPYVYLYVTNKVGCARSYRYELFKDGKPTFTDAFSFLQPVERRLSPIGYAIDNNLTDYDNSVVSAGTPVCAWRFDTYSQYLGANRNSIVWGLMSNAVINPAVMAFTGHPGMALLSATNSTLQTVSHMADMDIVPPTLQGNLAVQSLASIQNHLTMQYKQVTITAEYARMIDDYFTMYGYHVNRLKVPNINTRPSWNYVQTQKAMITGSIPFGDLDIIRNNFNRGITFWHGDWVGDYTRNNGETGYTPPVGPVGPPIEPPTDSVTWGVPFIDWQSHVTSEYGWRTNPITGEGQQFHSGIDIAYPTGTQIMAIANGTVTRETSSSGRGMYMDVKVNEEYTYRYQHLSAYDVPNNAAVTLGEYIAKVGATGDVTGPHLHLEILKNGQTVDPRPYLEGAYNG